MGVNGKATFKIDLPMPDIDKIEAARGTGKGNGSVDVNINVTSNGGKGGGGSNALRDVAGHKVHESWFGAYGAIEDDTSKPIENLIGRLNDLANASDSTGNKVKEASKAMALFETEFSPKKFERLTKSLQKTMSADEFKDAINGTGGGGKKGGKKGGGRRATHATPDIIPDGGGMTGGGGGRRQSGGGGGHPSADTIRYFKSIEELTEYLDGKGLRDASTSINKFLSDLQSVPKNIRATFGRDGILTGVGLTAAGKKYGAAEIGKAAYRFSYNPDDDSYQLATGGAQTQVYTDKIAKYEQAIAQKKKELVNTLTSIYNLPILQGTEKTNDLKAQLMQIVKETPNGLELISSDGMDQLNAAEEATKALQANIKAINAQVSKKWANNSLEKMDKNVEQMKTERARMVESFKKIGKFDTDDRFKAFDEALRNYEGKNPDINIANPETRVAQYNAMATAHERVARALQEETVAYNANKRAKQQSNKVDRADRVTLASYERKYQQMGGGKPQQMAEARAALKRYRNAQEDAEKKRAYDDLQENMRWMRDDLDARYRPTVDQKKRNEDFAKENRKIYRNSTKQNRQAENIHKELAKMAQPYGGLESGILPEYISKALKQLESYHSENNLEKRSSKLFKLTDMMKTVREQDKRSHDMEEAAELLSKMNASGSPMVAQQRDNLAAALEQVRGLTPESSPDAVADAWANLAVKIREAAEAQKEYEKADAASNKQGTSLDTLIQQKSTAYEGYVKQLRTIQAAYDKMGKTLDTTTIDNLLNQFEATNVSDSDAMRMVKSKVSEELKRLGEMHSRDQNIFNAENKRDDITNNLNKWMDGLDIDESKLDKIKELKTALEELNNIDISADGGLAKFNQQFQNIGDIANAAKQQVEVIKRYKQVTSDKTYGILGHEHGTDAQRQESEALKKSLEDTYKKFLADPNDVAVMQQLNDQIMKMAAYLKDVEQIDAFGKMNEQVSVLESKMQAFTAKHGDKSKWGIGQQQVAQAFSDTMDRYQQQVQAGDLAGAKESFAALDGQVKALNSSFESGGGLVGVFDGKLTKLAGRLLGVGSGFMAIHKVIGTFKKMAGYVTQIDTAMTELKKVTDESATAYERFQKQSGKTAVQIGSSIKDLINTTVEYGRMGYSLAESQQLGVVTTKFANTGNFSGVTEASDALISIIRGFDDLDVGDAEMISDKLTAVANNYAVTASDIAEGLQRSASALNLGGVNLDQATAMITAVAEVTRDAGAAGNAIKVMSMRLRGAKTELEAAGEETNGMAESTSKLRAQVAALTNVNGQGGFDIMQDEDTFKSVYDIMLGISKVWDQMTDVKQSALLELMAGKVRANQVAALLNNMSRAEDILKTSEDSAGTADEVHAKWLESIAAKQAQLTASWENLSQTVMSSDMIKGFYSAGSDILNILDQIISKIGAFGPALAAVGTGFLGKLGGGNAWTGLKDLFTKNTGKVRGDFIEKYNEAFWQTGDKTTATGKAIKAMQEKVGEAGFEMNKAEQFAIKYSEGIVNVGNGASIASMKLQALSGVFKGLLANLAISGALMAISALFNYIGEEWDKAVNAEDHAVKAADDAQAEYEDAQKQVESLNSELEKLDAQYQELANKGPLSFADEQTKNDLKEQTAELRLQLRIAEQLAAQKEKTAYQLSKEAWKTQYNVNETAAAKIKDTFTGTGRDATKYIEGLNQEYDEYIQSRRYRLRDFADTESEGASQAVEDLASLQALDATVDSVLNQVSKYLEDGRVGNDVLGSIAMLEYLADRRKQASEEIQKWSGKPRESEFGMLGITSGDMYDSYVDIVSRSEEPVNNLKKALIEEYSALNDVIEKMELYGDTAEDDYKYYKMLRDAIGESVVPDVHASRKLLELRKSSPTFKKMYDDLEDLARNTEITQEIFDQYTTQEFRDQLDEAGINVENLIAQLNELYEAAAPALSTTTASGISTAITGLLGHRSTAAEIFKNTGYGNPISKDDYQKLVDMNDTDFLKAVEYSHGTAFFNIETFTKTFTEKMTEQYDKMYDDMMDKQSEYIKETDKLKEALRDLAVAQAEQNTEAIKDAQKRIDTSTANLSKIQDEINMYNRLAMQIKAVSSAYGRWQLAHGAPEEGDNYDQALEAYKDLEEGFKTGRVGNASYKAAQEYLLGKGGNYYGDEKQRKMLERYLNKSNPNEKDSTDTGWGARNFQKDLIEKGILNNDGSLKGDWFIEDIANAMGMGADLVEHMFGELNEFIADEEKKYKVQSKTVEDMAQSVDYDKYIQAKQAYEDAVAQYRKDPSSKEALAGLYKAANDLALAGEEINLDTYNLAMQQLDSSTQDNTAAINAATSMLNGLISAIVAKNGGAAGMHVEYQDGKYQLLDADGKAITDATGKAITGFNDIFSYLLKQENNLTQTFKEIDDLNAEAIKAGINRRMDLSSKGEFVVVDATTGEEIGKYADRNAALEAMWGDTAKAGKELVEMVNSVTAMLGINKSLSEHGGQWYVSGIDKPFDTAASALTEIFVPFANEQRESAQKLAEAIATITGEDFKIDLSQGTITVKELDAETGKLEEKTYGMIDGIAAIMKSSGYDFGQQALAAWNAELEAKGLQKIDYKDGKYYVGDIPFDDIAGAVASAFGDKLTEVEGIRVIQDTLKAVGRTGAVRYENGSGYIVTDEEGKSKTYATSTEAMADIGGKEVNAFTSAIDKFNASLTDAGSTLQATINAGKTTITDTATGEAEQFSDFATAVGGKLQSASDSIKTVADTINTINSAYGIAAADTALVTEAMGKLKDTINSGAGDVGEALKELNKVLAANGIKEALGINADGKFTFGEKIYDTFDQLIDAAFGSLEWSPIDATDTLNNLLGNLNITGKKFEFGEEAGKTVYRLLDSETGATLKTFDSYTAAITDLTSGSMSQLQDMILAINDAYAAAGSEIRASIDDGKATLAEYKEGEKKEIIAQGDEIQKALTTYATDAYDALAQTLSSIRTITVKVEASGEFTVVDKDGNPITDETTGQPKTVASVLSDSLGDFENAIDGLSKVIDGFGIDENGDFKLGEKMYGSFYSVLNEALPNVSAESIAKSLQAILGATPDYENGKFKFNGNIYDTFEQMMRSQWDNSGFQTYAKTLSTEAQTSGAKVKGLGDAASEAAAALKAFNAALAADSLNRNLSAQGRGGRFAADADGNLVYFNDVGTQTGGPFATTEAAYQYAFPNYGKWQFRQTENGYEAFRTATGDTIKGFEEIVEKIDKITSAEIFAPGQVRLNDWLETSLGGWGLQNGQLTINANGADIPLGNVSDVKFDADGNVTTFFNGKGEQIFSLNGAYGMDANGNAIARPKLTGLERYAQVGDISGEVATRYKELLNYASTAVGKTDAEAQNLVNALKSAIDEDPTGKLFEAFSDYVDTFGFTQTAYERAEQLRREEEERIKREEEARLAREKEEADARNARRQAGLEAARKSVYQASDTRKLKDAYAKGEISDDEVAEYIGKMYNIPALLAELQKTNPKLKAGDVPGWILGSDYEDGVDIAEKYRVLGSTLQALIDQTNAEKAEAARIAAEEAAAKAEADRIKKEEADAAAAMVREQWEKTGQAWSEFFGKIGDRLGEDYDTLIKQPVEAGVNWAAPLIEGALGWLYKNTSENAEKNKDITEGIINTPNVLFGDTFDTVDKALTAVYKWFVEDAPKQEAQTEKPIFPSGFVSQATPMEYYQRGNVDLKNRPVVAAHALSLAGWEDVGDGFATMFSTSLTAGSDGIPFNQDIILHVTPITEDGQVLSEDYLNDYVYELLQKSGGDTNKVLELDKTANGGLGLINWIQNVTDGWENALDEATKFDLALSKAQADFYGIADGAHQTARDIIGALTAFEDTEPNVDVLDAAYSKTIDTLKAMYDLDKIRAEYKGGAFAGISDVGMLPVLYSMGETLDYYKKDQAKEPIEVPVDANTSNAEKKIDALGNRNQTITVTANVVYNDQGYTTRTTAGVPNGGKDTYVAFNAKGTNDANAGTSLVDEEGAELIEHVSRGTYELGTDNGPRFTQLDNGDIVHTAEETKKIQRRGLLGRVADAFRNGGVKIGGAFRVAQDSGGSAKKIIGALKEVSGGGTIITDGSGSALAGANNKKKSSGGGKNSGAGLKNALKWAESLVDWIPTALDNLKKKTTEYIRAAEKAVGYLARNSDLTKAIENVRAEIQLTQRAAERYEKQANEFATRSGLAADIITKIKEGTIDIEEYDENTRKAIQTYQTWWDKAKGCNDTLDSLNDQLYDLSKQKLDNIVNYFGNINDMLEQQIETYNSMIKVKEAYGQEMTRTDYLDAIRLTQQVIENLSKEQKTLQEELDYQVNSGVIKVGSDDWYNYAKQIEEVTSTINDAKVELSDLNDEVKGVTMNNLKTSIYYLDNLQNRIEGLQKLRDVQNEFNTDLNSYRVLISNGMKQIDNLEQQNEQLRQQMEGLDVLSEKYHDIYQQLQDNESTILDIKTSQEEWNDAIIDLKIDMLEKQNEKYQQQMNLMKALNELEDARQRKILMYSNEDGFKYVADEDELESAQDTVNEQIHDLIVRGLEQQKYENNIYDNMGNQLIPVTDMLAGIDFSRYYDSINRGSETSALLTSILSNIDIPDILSKTSGGDVSIDIGDIILNGVNDAQSLGDAIIAQLPGYLVQAIYSKNT